MKAQPPNLRKHRLALRRWSAPQHVSGDGLAKAKLLLACVKCKSGFCRLKDHKFDEASLLKGIRTVRLPVR